MFKKLLLLSLITPALLTALTLDDFESGDLEIEGTSTGVVATGTSTSNGAIGNVRHLFTTKTSGPLSVNLEVTAGLLLHSQRANVSGKSYIAWNADSANNASRSQLNGINLLQDILDVESSDGIIIDIFSYDFANNAPTNLELRIFSTDGGLSIQTQTLSAAINSDTDLLFSFDNFVQMGPNGPANLEKVSSIVLSISGDGTDTDLAINSIRTTGCSPIIPTLTSQPIDRCEVCGGDGSSCCENFSVSKTQRAMDGGVKKLERVIKKMLRQLRRKTKGDVEARSFIRTTIKRVHQNQIEGWQLSWQPQSEGEICTGTRFCVNTSNTSILDEYRIRTTAMVEDAYLVKDRLDALRGGESKRTLRFEQKVLKIHNRNLELSNTMPSHISSCS